MNVSASCPLAPEETLRRIATLEHDVSSPSSTTPSGSGSPVVAFVNGSDFTAALRGSGVFIPPRATGTVSAADGGSTVLVSIRWGPFPSWLPRLLAILGLVGALGLSAASVPWPVGLVVGATGVAVWFNFVSSTRLILQTIATAVGDLAW